MQKEQKNQLQQQTSNKCQQKPTQATQQSFKKVETIEDTNLQNNEDNTINSNKNENSKKTNQQEIQQNKQQATKNEVKNKKQPIDYDDQIPQKFYDSDLASVNEKDFMSDNQPPKDIVYERKLLHKQKKLHIYKTIVVVGKNIDKPAPFDEIRLRYRNQPNTTSEGLEQAKTKQFIQNEQYIVYNLGKKNEQIERLVTSMKQGETALFQIQQLEVSKKTNIKVLKQKTVYVIQVDKWTTVIDIDGNKDILKYLLRRGEGPHRVSKYDQVSYNLAIKYKNVQIIKQNKKQIKVQQQVINAMQPVEWKILSTMKKNQLIKVKINDENMQAISAIWTVTQQKQQKQGTKLQSNIEDKNKQVSKQKQQNDASVDKQSKQQKTRNQKNYVADLSRYDELINLYQNISKNQLKSKQIETQSQVTQIQQKKYELIKTNKYQQWEINMQVLQLISIDDIYMDGRLLKKILIRGVSTAKPQSSSLIYYALKYLDEKKNVLQQDKCFNSDWWEDYSKLDELGCRKNYMDEYKMSKFLKASMKRMKPAEVSQIQCRDTQLFKYGHDYEQLKKLWPQEKQFPPKRVYMIVRVYNFTEGKNCFNMQINEKVQESKRKKIAAVKLLNDGNYKKAFKRFQNIVSFYGSGDINQAAYDQKISALMNSMLCLMKMNRFSEMIPLCNSVLQRPKHGFNQDKMKIKAQGIKVEGNTKNADGQDMDEREAADLLQNGKIIDKCLYRKALALLKIGQSQHSLQCLQQISQQTEEVRKLRAEAEKHLQNYQEKSKKLFKNMFG